MGRNISEITGKGLLIFQWKGMKTIYFGVVLFHLRAPFSDSKITVRSFADCFCVVNVY